METLKFIVRQSYIDKILPFTDKNLIKVITGQRRVGKSFILYQVINKIQQINPYANIIFIDKEKFEFDHITNYTDLINYVQDKILSNSKNYLFIDEIQDIEGFEKALRHFYSDNKIDIYCTGSNAQLLSGELATYLSGRYIEIKIYSLSYKEFLNFYNLDNNSDALKIYMNFGGLPFLINLPNDENIKYDYLKNIFSTIIYKDVVARHNIRNTFFLENLVKFIANNTGNILSAKKISDYLKSQKQNISTQVVLNYLSNLQDAFLIFKVNRTDLIGKRIFELSEKYYFEDWGIKNAIVGLKQYNVNQIIENIIFLHLKINGYEVTIGKLHEFEIDFVAERNGEKIYIQAAYLITDQLVIDREFGNLLKIKDNWKKIVVSLDEYTLKNFEGIEHLKLIDFLTNIT